MATQNRESFIDEGVDRVQEAWNNVEDEFGKFQKTVEKRRKQFERDAQKRVKKLRSTPFVKRVESIRDDAQKQIEDNVESFLGYLPIASRNEVQRLERKISKLQRRVTSLEKELEAAEAARSKPAKPAARPVPESQTARTA